MSTEKSIKAVEITSVSQTDGDSILFASNGLSLEIVQEDYSKA